MCVGLEKVLSGSLGREDFLVWQVIYKAYLSNGQGSRQVILKLNNKY